jgi:hypothetical protein
MQSLGKTKNFKHIIREDGTIRRATKGVANLHDGEIVVEDATLRQPGFWFYDFGTKKLLQYSDAQLQAQQDAKVAATAAAQAAVDVKRADLRTKIDNQPAEIQSIFNLILELVGLDDV